MELKELKLNFDRFESLCRHPCLGRDPYFKNPWSM